MDSIAALARQHGQRLAPQRHDARGVLAATGSRRRTPRRSRPGECPTTASGVTPAACHTAARETITAHSAGWTTSAASSSAVPGQHVVQRPVHERGQRGGALVQPRREHRRATPAAPGPCPATANPDRGTRRPYGPRRRRAAHREITPGAGCPSATAASPAASSSRPEPTTTARCSNADRVVASDHATSSGPAPGGQRELPQPPGLAGQRRRRAARHRPRRHVRSPTAPVAGSRRPRAARCVLGREPLRG